MTLPTQPSEDGGTTMRQQLLDALFGDGGWLRVRAGLALLFSGATVYLFVSGDPVPEELLAVNSLVVGVYFGARTASTGT